MQDLACEKERFSLPEGAHYLNCAYMSPLMKSVEEAGIAGVRRKARPFEITPPDFFADGARVRALFARLVNAPDPHDVAIVPAVSYGFAQVANNLDVQPRQRIVALHEGFPSNIYVWRRLAARTGAELVVVGPPEERDARGARWNDALVAAIDAGTVAVAVAPAHWTDGTLFDLARIGEAARRVGAALVVDGTQCVGAMPFDVLELQPDALVCAAYKWLMGPYSIGVAYMGERFHGGVPIEETWMAREGSEDFAGLVNYRDEYRPRAVRFDVGESSNFALVPMLVESLTQVLAWGPERVTAYGRALTQDLFPPLREHGYQVAPESERAAHLFGIRVPAGTDPQELAARLRERQVYVSVRGTSVRVSVHVFNDAADIAALRHALLT